LAETSSRALCAAKSMDGDTLQSLLGRSKRILRVGSPIANFQDPTLERRRLDLFVLRAVRRLKPISWD
jgi:hypothetical protein